MAVFAAAAFGTVDVDGHVPEFTGRADRTAVDPFIDDDAAANTGGNGDVDKVLDELAGAEPGFGQGGAVGVIVHEHGYPEVFFQDLLDIDLFPARQVRGFDHYPFII